MDIIRQFIDLLYVKIPHAIDEHVARELEETLRMDFGGERVYVPRDGDKDRDEISMRNAAIRRDWQNGERVELLMRRYGLSRQRIYQIVKVSP